MDAALAQYGAVGLIAGLALLATKTLFSRMVKAHESETARADRAEAELSRLNEIVRTQYLTVLSQATSTMGDTLRAVREMRSLYEQEQNRRRG